MEKLLRMGMGLIMKITLKYNLHQRVKLIEIKLPAIIEEISIGINGNSYRCSYWNNERYSVWVLEEEINELSD